MSTQEIRQKKEPAWEEKIVRLKRRFPKLTTIDLNYTEAAKFEMFKHLEFKLALTAKEINTIIETP